MALFGRFSKRFLRRNSHKIKCGVTRFLFVLFFLYIKKNWYQLPQCPEKIGLIFSTIRLIWLKSVFSFNSLTIFASILYVSLLNIDGFIWCIRPLNWNNRTIKNKKTFRKTLSIFLNYFSNLLAKIFALGFLCDTCRSLFLLKIKHFWVLTISGFNE